jgi:hypothetical protein
LIDQLIYLISLFLGGACGFGDYGKIVNDGSGAAVSAKLWKNGEGCGACYQVSNFSFHSFLISIFPIP